MTTDTAAPQSTPILGAEGNSALVTDHPALTTYRAPLSNTWWLRNRRYTRFMIREFTVVPITLWLLSLLVALPRARAGADYAPQKSLAYVLFSLVCLVFSLYHSFTWLGISGLIL